MENQEETSLQRTTENSEAKVSVPYNRSVISNHKNKMKAHSYDDDLLMEMARRLNSIAYAMGFRDIEIDTVLSLSKWIKAQFGDISMQEVAAAFDLVTAKKIGNNIRHYAEFSQQYIGDVLSAFRVYRAQQIKLFEDHKKQIEITKNPAKVVTDQEMYEGIKRIALDTGKIMKVADWTGAYNHAWKERLIHRMSEQERVDYKKSVEKAIKTERHAGIQIGDYSIQSECHKRIMKVHFQEMIDKREME